MLRALDLTKSYDGAPLFEGLSLTLNPGDRAGLVGPNGAGKSTLLRLLAGGERPDRGSITTAATVGHLPQEAPAATLDELLHDRARRGRRGARRAAPPRRPRRLRPRARARRGHRRLGGRGARRGGPPPPRHRAPRQRPAAAAPLRRRAGPRAARRDAAPGPRRPAARRAHQPPRRRRPRLARGLPRRASTARCSSSPTTAASSTRSSRASTSSGPTGLTAYEGGYTRLPRREGPPPRPPGGARRGAGQAPPPARGRHRRHPRLRAPHASAAPPAWAPTSRSATPRRSPRRRRRASTGWSARWPRSHGSSARASRPPSRLRLDAAADRGRRVARLDGVSARVLHDVDLTLHGGERVAISGPNGAGKTTLLSLLLGTLAADAPARSRSTTSVRLLPQRPHELQATGPLLPWFRRHARPGIDESEARTLLAHFGLGADAVGRPLERLSPGQRARAAIAAIVASEADLLLLDEPTNHLDFDTLDVLERALAAHRARSSPSPTTAGSSTRSAPRATCTSRPAPSTRAAARPRASSARRRRTSASRAAPRAGRSRRRGSPRVVQRPLDHLAARRLDDRRAAAPVDALAVDRDREVVGERRARDVLRHRDHERARLDRDVAHRGEPAVRVVGGRRDPDLRPAAVDGVARQRHPVLPADQPADAADARCRRPRGRRPRRSRGRAARAGSASACGACGRAPPARSAAASCRASPGGSPRAR